MILSYMGSESESASDAYLIFILVFFYEAWEMHSNFHVLKLWFYNATMKESMKESKSICKLKIKKAQLVVGIKTTRMQKKISAI